MQGKRILVIDGDPSLRRLLEYSFSQAGGQVYTAADGQEGLRQLYAHRPDLVILDIVMPNMDGWETCHHIRQLSEVPIIILSGLRQEDDVIRGLDCGADDYVTKPFSVKVLLARARAVLRRAALPPVTEEPVIYNDDYLTVDRGRRQVLVRGEPVKLTPTEYGLLAYLVQNAGRVVTCRQILEKIWGWEYQDDVDYVRVYIWHLRQKLEEDPRNPQYVLTEYGVGYRFERRHFDRRQRAGTVPEEAFAVHSWGFVEATSG